MQNGNLLTALELRRAWVINIRDALTTAERLAAGLADSAEVGIQAQALLHRLAAIRAEVDFLELPLLPSAGSQSFRPPAEDRRRPQTLP